MRLLCSIPRSGLRLRLCHSVQAPKGRSGTPPWHPPPRLHPHQPAWQSSWQQHHWQMSPRRRGSTLGASGAQEMPKIRSSSSTSGRGKAFTPNGKAHTAPKGKAAGTPKGSAPATPKGKAPATLKGKAEVDASLKAKAAQIAKQLGALYPNPPIPLDHTTNYQLLVAVVLSAQSTDKKVNEITPNLFKIAPDAHRMALLDVATIQEAIKAIGLAKTKASNLKRAAEMLVELHGGEVPSTFEELEALPGVGHKTASVIMAQAFNHPAFPVDTHIHRLAQRWGLTDGKNVERTEADLKAAFPEPLWNDLHLQIIYFGREHCPAPRHDPAACPICSWAAVSPYDEAGVSPLKPGKSAASANGKSPAAKRKGAAKSAITTEASPKPRKASGKRAKLEPK
mmetsp:Transcript_446/g.1349  ORF Transcript_446/g.1349 Transcript_446/m.1349 type:complete len:395 (+) Transcript_446:177-1361(+)